MPITHVLKVIEPREYIRVEEIRPGMYKDAQGSIYHKTKQGDWFLDWEPMNLKIRVYPVQEEEW